MKSLCWILWICSYICAADKRYKIISVAKNYNATTIEKITFHDHTHNTSLIVLSLKTSLNSILSEFNNSIITTFLVTPMPSRFTHVVMELQENIVYFLDVREITTTENQYLWQMQTSTTSDIIHLDDVISEIIKNTTNSTKRLAIITNNCWSSFATTVTSRLGKIVYLFCPDLANIANLQYLCAHLIEVRIQSITLLMSSAEATFITNVARLYDYPFYRNILWRFIDLDKQSLLMIPFPNNIINLKATAKKLSSKEDIFVLGKFIHNNIEEILQQHTLTVPKNTIIKHDDMQEYEATLPQQLAEHRKPFIRFASLLYSPLVFELPSGMLEDGLCQRGLPCKIPIKRRDGEALKYRKACCAGLIIEYLTFIMKTVDFDYEIYMVEDNTFGGFVNGSWTGIMKDVHSRKADIGLQSITTLYERSQYVDFTDPILASTFGIIRRSKTPTLKVVNWVFLTYLGSNLLLLIIATFVACSILIFVCENISLHIIKKKRYKTREIFTYLSGLLFQRDMGGKTPKRWTSRIPSIAYAAAMTIVMTTYTANLTASNIVYDDNDDFRGLKDEKITNPTTNFKFGVMNNTSFQLYMMKKSKTYSFLKDYLVPNDHVALEKILNRELDGYIADYIYLNYLTALPAFCSKLRIYEEKSISVFSAFAVRKKSRWKDIFSQAILDIQETGKMDMLMNKWIFLKGCKSKEIEVGGIPWQYFGGLLVWTSLSVLLSIFILKLEHIYENWKLKKTFQRFSTTTVPLEADIAL